VVKDSTVTPAGHHAPALARMLCLLILALMGAAAVYSAAIAVVEFGQIGV
jgi:hypothetical protein